MTTAEAMGTYHIEIIGFGHNTVGTTRSNVFIAEGLELFEDFLTSEKDDIKSFCYTIYNPGGFITNPEFNATKKYSS